jgi:hypothetical protein
MEQREEIMRRDILTSLAVIAVTGAAHPALAAVNTYSAEWTVSGISGPWPTMEGNFTISFDPDTVPFVNDIITPTRDTRAGSLSFTNTRHRFDYFKVPGQGSDFLVGAFTFVPGDSNNSLIPGEPDFRVRFLLDDRFRLISARGGVGDGVGTPPFYAFDTSVDGSRATFRLSINGAPVPVPEPGTWMTMICGFGLIGVALRKHSARQLSRIQVR